MATHRIDVLNTADIEGEGEGRRSQMRGRGSLPFHVRHVRQVCYGLLCLFVEKRRQKQHHARVVCSYVCAIDVTINN